MYAVYFLLRYPTVGSGGGLCASKIHVSHRTWPGCVFRSKVSQFETGRAGMTISCNVAPDGGEPTLPALNSRLGRKPMFYKK